jgi:hypothetical protein
MTGHAPPPDATQAEPAARGPRARRSLARRLALAAGSLAIMAAIALLGLFVLLSTGPVPAPLLGERVAAALEQRIGNGITVAIRETVVEKTDAGLELHAHDVTFRDAAGKVIIAAPDAMIGFDPLALATMRVEPRSLRLRGLAIQATIRPDWDIRLSTSDGKLQADAAASAQDVRLQDALAFLAAVARTGRLAGLNELAVTGARLIIDDQRVGREKTFDDMSAVFTTPGSGKAVLSGSVTREGTVTPYRLEAVTGDDGARLNLSVTNIPLRVAETIGGSTALAIEGDSTAALHATLDVGPDGAARTGAADLRLTPGAILVPSLFEGPWRVKEARVEASWSHAAPYDAPFKARFAGDGGSGGLLGTVAIAQGAGGEHRLDGRVDGLTLTPLSPRDGQIAVTEGTLKLRVPQAGS